MKRLTRPEGCICKFKMVGIMTEDPEEVTEHNPTCPIHKLNIDKSCKCVVNYLTGIDAEDKPIYYAHTVSSLCRIHKGTTHPYLKINPDQVDT